MSLSTIGGAVVAMIRTLAIAFVLTATGCAAAVGYIVYDHFHEESR